MKKIEDSNKKVIKDNIKTLKKYNLNENDIYQKHIEDIYLEIIKTLIKDQKLDKIDNIMIELEFESIPFNNIINELNKIIDKKVEYINKQEISEFNDLFSDRMTYYYILIKYIFKHSIFINQNTFLNETRKKIVSLIEANLKSLYKRIIDIKDGNLKIKVEYVLGYFCDYPNYYNKSKSIYEKDNDKSNSNLTSNPCSNPIFKEAQSQSNKSFDIQYDSNVDINDLAFGVLKKSTFKFHIKRKG